MAQFAGSAVGTVTIGLVDHEDVADLQDAGLDGLDPVAQARCQHHDRGVGLAGDLHLGLPDADRLDEHRVAAGRVQDARPPAASTRLVRRDGRGRPSSG